MLFKSEIFQRQERAHYLLECRRALNSMHHGTLEIEGRKIILENEIARGGFKIIYDIGDSKVIALRNTNDGISDLTIMDWEEGIAYESKMSARIQQLGLHTQDYQRVEVKIDGHTIPALTMSHFKSLLSKNLQIRGNARSESFGTSMLFGGIENLTSESYYRELFRPLVKDIITLIANKINLVNDCFGGLIIQNTSQTPVYSEQDIGTVVSRKQELHLFLMDFYQKGRFFQRGDLIISDDKFNPKSDKIKKMQSFI